MSIEECGGKHTYDDLQVSVARTQFPGVSDPTWRTYDYGLGGISYQVLGFAVNDYVEFTIQTTHATKLSSVLDQHMHFILPNTTTIGHKIKWQLDIIGAPINGTYAVLASSPFSAVHTVAADDNIKHRYLDLADLNTINTTVSALFKCRLTRVDASASGTNYSSEVYVDFIDSHILQDSDGSRQEGVK